MSRTEMRHIGASLLAALIAVVAVTTGCDDEQSGSGKGGGGAVGQSHGGQGGQADTGGAGGIAGAVGTAGGSGHGGGAAGSAGAPGSSGSGGRAGAAGASTGSLAGAGGRAGAGGQGPGGSVSAGGSAGAGGQGVPSGSGGREMNPTCEGDGTSGRLLSLCGYYCSSVTAYCEGASKQYASFEDCTSRCYAPTWLCGTEGPMTGNTVSCRLWHAKRAINSPDTECAAAGPNSTICI